MTWARGGVFAVLLTLVACAPLRPVPRRPPPQVVIVQVRTDRVHLTPGADSATLSLTIDYAVDHELGSGPPEGPPEGSYPRVYWLRTRVAVVDSETGALLTMLENDTIPLPPSGTNRRELFELDSEALALGPGDYTLQPIILASERDRIDDRLDDLYSEWLEGGTGDFSLTTGKAVGFRVLDTSPDALAGYRALIASGRPDAVLRGLSELILHARASGRFDLAETEAEAVIRRYGGASDAGQLRHVFRTWQADDIARQGDPERAVALLRKAARTHREQSFLGLPFGAAALEQQARIWRAEGEPRREIAVYDELIASYRTLDATARYRAARAEASLRAGDWQGARRDLESIADQAQRCKAPEVAAPKATPASTVPLSGPPTGPSCPGDDELSRAADALTILDSDRAWFRDGLPALAESLKRAFEAGDLNALDNLARAPDFQFGNPGGHTIRAPWSLASRSYFESRLTPGRYSVHVPGGLDSWTSRSAVLVVEDSMREPGDPSHIALMMQETPFGAQWRGLGGLRLDNLDDFEPELPGGGGGGGGGTPPPPPTALRMKASWAPGTHMRAGGMRLDFESLIDTPISDFVGSFLHTDRCGSGIPGYFYNTNETHKGRDTYSIDFVKGATLVCTPGWVPFAGDKCLPNVADATAEWLDAVAKLIPSLEQPVRHGAFLEPVYLGHAGLVVNVVSDRPNGDKDGLNRVDVAAWRYPPRSIRALTGATTISGSTASDSVVADRLNAISPLPEFWLKYLHLAHESECAGCAPSLGMWVDRGRLIGRVDDTGSSSFMSHLHVTVYGRPTSATAPFSVSDWQSGMQHIENEFIGTDDDGRCIESSNELVTDTDDDGISDSNDNCVRVPNPEQVDFDGDDVGDICSDDRDNDGIPNAEDSCPDSFDWFGLRDIDLDGVNDLSLDLDGDGVNNSCDPDADGDGVPNESDICEFGNDADDMDGDGDPDFCDVDADGDGATMFDGLPGRNCPPQPDLFPFDPTLIGDYDEDGIDDIDDPCPCTHVNPVCIPTLTIDHFGTLQRFELR